MAGTPFQDLPLADQSGEWDAPTAEQRVRGWAGAPDELTEKHRNGYVCCDLDKTANFGSCTLPFGDVVDGRLAALPRGVRVAGSAVPVRGAVDQPATDVARLESRLAASSAKPSDAAPRER